MGAGSTARHRARAGGGFSDALRSRTFVVLYAAETQSIAGDQLARVSLAVLVFDRTDSASATALVYALTYLPAIAGGFTLGGVGDRMPRRAVMVWCDLLRAGLFVVMAASGLPLGVLTGLLAVAVFLGPAFTSAEVSYLAATLPPDVFRAGTGLRMISGQGAQVGGFAVGGVLVAALGAHTALLVNAATFLVSAALIGLAVDPGRRAMADGAAGEAHDSHDDNEADVQGETGPSAERSLSVMGLLRIPRIRSLLGLSTLAGLFIVPEGLAVPFGADVGAGPAQTGLLLASIPLGGAIGVVLLVRYVDRQRRKRVANLMAIGCGLPLVPVAVIEHWPVAAGFWLISGIFAAYQVEVLSAMMQATPDSSRSRLVGMGSAILLGAQGLGLAISGWVADLTSPARAIAAAGALGSVLAVLLVIGPLRTQASLGAQSVHAER